MMEFTFSNNSQLSYLSHDVIYNIQQFSNNSQLSYISYYGIYFIEYYSAVESFSRYNLHYRIIHSYRIFLTMKFTLLNNSHLTIFLTMEFTLSNNSQLSNVSNDVNLHYRITRSYCIIHTMEFTFSNNSQLPYLSQDGIYFLE